jgi:hypothetical protein
LLVEEEYKMEQESLARVEIIGDVPLSPIVTVQQAIKSWDDFQEIVKGRMKKGYHYDEIPGTDKPSLLDPGGDLLCKMYGLSDVHPTDPVRLPGYVLERVTEDWERDPPLFDYTVSCILYNTQSGRAVRREMASCNSYEDKYRWRDQKRTCPRCKAETIIKGSDTFGGGWVCWRKQGGCGTKFQDGDVAIEDQITGRIPNPDIANQKNTILQMAQKRAKLRAVRAATLAGEMFTQDVDDMTGNEENPTNTKPGGRGSKTVDETGPLVTELESVGVTRAQIALKFRHDPVACSPAEIAFLKSAITTLKISKNKKFNDLTWPPPETKPAAAEPSAPETTKQENGNGKKPESAEKSPNVSDLFGHPADPHPPPAEPQNSTIKGTPYVKMLADVIKAEGWWNLEEINAVLLKEWNIPGIEDIPMDDKVYRAIMNYFREHKPPKRK